MAVLRFIGHSTFELSSAGKTFLFDPWFSQSTHFYRMQNPAVSPGSFKKCDFILISHEHSDHCDRGAIEEICSRTFAQVIGPRESLAGLSIPQKLKNSVEVGNNFSLLGVDFEVVAANHPQSVHPVGYVVHLNENGVMKRIYFAGDTYDYYGMSSISCDVAIIPIGGRFTMDELGAIKALKQIKAKYVIPMHYNTFNEIKADARGFAARVSRDTKVQPIILQSGQEWRF